MNSGWPAVLLLAIGLTGSASAGTAKLKSTGNTESHPKTAAVTILVEGMMKSRSGAT